MSNVFSERLTSARLKDLAALLLRVEYQTPSRKIVEPLLDLLVGGSFDLKQNFLIREPNVILLILELLPHLSDNIQLELWSTLGAILHQCLPNTSSCHQLGLAEKCLEHLCKTKNDKVAGYIGSVLEMLAGYSLSVKQLKGILSYLYTSPTDHHWAHYSVLLIGALNNISVGTQPDVFFSFSGGHGAVLTLPPVAKWPGNSGFTISTWVRAEKPYDLQREYYKPVVYWFRTGRGLGYSAHFIGSNLVLETVSKNAKKPQTHSVDYVFHSYQWHMITVSYQYHRLKSSEVCCYVDGLLTLNAEVTLPSHDEIYDKCFLGGNHVATPDSVFQGQMAALYIWKEQLGKSTIEALYKLGPGYKSQFKFEAEVDVPLTSNQQKVLFGNLANSLVISYNAKAVDGQLCLEASPAQNDSFFVHSPHATMLEGVDPIITTSFHSALHSLGGIQAFFPLFSQLDVPQFIPSKREMMVDYTLSVKLLSLIFELARNSITYMFQLVQMKALELISDLLEKVSPAHLTEDLLSSTFDFMRYLSVAPFGEELLQQLIEHLLLNTRLWIRASKEVQIYLYSQLATEFCMQRLGKTSLDLRDVIGVSYLMYVLKEYYSLKVDQRHEEIRPYLILIVKQCVTKGRGIEVDELTALLNYLSSVPEEENLFDVLKLLVALVFEDTNVSLMKLLKTHGGLQVAAKLLASSSEELRIDALKIISKVLHQSNTKEQQSILEGEGLVTVAKEKLLSSGQRITIPMFNTLFELMLDQPSRRVIESYYITLDPSHRIIFSGFLQVLIELICTLNNCEGEGDNEQNFMRMQLFTYITSLCSQNNCNCSSLLNLPHWQYWLMKLADVKNQDYDSLQTMLHQLLHIVLMYGLQEEEEGWRLWVESTATMHAYEIQSGPHSYKSTIVSQTSFQDESSSVSLMGSERGGDGNIDSTSSLTPPLPRSDLSRIDDTPETRTGLEPKSTESCAVTSQMSGTSDPPVTGGSVSVIPIVKSSSKGGKKLPKFHWSTDHRKLLRTILLSVKSVVDEWKSDTDTVDNLTHKHNAHLVLNTVQIIVLVVDSLLSLVGGIKSLVTECCQISMKRKKSSKREDDPSSPLSAECLLRLCLELYENLVFNGQFKFSAIEARMNMEPGGVLRQSLRLIFTIATLDCIKANTEYEDQHCHYNRHKQAIEQLRQHSNTLLKVIGIDGSCLDTYVRASLEGKIQSLRQRQLLLSEEIISLLQKVVSKDMENKSSIISSTVYYLAVLCVARYKNILDSIDKEQSETVILPHPASRTRSMTDSDKSQSPQLSLHDLSSLKGDRRSIDIPLTPSDPWDAGITKEAFSLPPHLVRSDSQDESMCSSIGSASDLREFNEKSLTFLGTEGILHPPTVLPLTQAIDVSEQVNVSLKLVGACLCQLFVENKAILTKVLTTVDGRQLLSDAALKLAENYSVVEITMLLCSQEWQNSLQKTAGKYFNSLLSEGRHIAHFSESYFKGLSSEIVHRVKTSESDHAEIFTQFEEHLSLFLSSSIRTSQEERRVRRAEILRHSTAAENLWRQLSPMVDHCGSFDFTPLKPTLLWRLDMREDAQRRRMKLSPNPNGSTHADALRTIPDYENTGEKSMLDHELIVSPLHGEDEETIEEESEVLTTIDMSLMESKEAPKVSLKCSLIALTNRVPGTLSFTRNYLTFIADDTSDEYQEIAALTDIYPLSDRWNLNDVTAVFTRRYLQQNKALEIFFSNKTSVFIVFENQRELKRVVNLLPKVGVGPNYGLPQSRSVSLLSPSALFKRSDMTEKWSRRDISNFEYLMFINTAAGRSFNDLSQYPVFPWILTDYTSNKIDLKDPSIYRDLSKPIGALDSKRRSQFEERYDSWENDIIPPFHYGTHYSTLAFVVHWLVRVEPFTSLHIALHDGFFDHGSRIFSSIARAWNNCQLDSSDVKELIPELFCLPHMLTNTNKFLLGYDEHGEMGEEMPEGEIRVVNDVMLPPWAENAQTFVQIHREALESDYVSAHLHNWIDLIFGFKQTGKPAVEATNVFYYITYPGSVNWNGTTDEKQRKAIEQQVLQFGQTPAQILKEPHPQRQPKFKEFPPQPVSSRNPAVVVQFPITLDVPIGLVQLSSFSSSLLTISYNQLFAVNKFNYVAGTSSQPPIVNIEKDLANTSSLQVRLGDPLDQSITTSSICFTATPSVDIVLMCGFWDSSFKTFSTDTGQLIQSVFGHRNVVTCISYSQESGLCSMTGDGIIATGSHDVTVLLWKWSGKLNRVVSQLKTPQGSVTPLAILNGHERTVTCVALSASLGLVASGTKNGCCLLHSTSGELLHKLVPSSSVWSHPHMIASSSHGLFIVHYADQKGCLAVFTCNGEQLAYKPLNEPALALTVSNDGDYIIIGGFSGRAYVLHTHTLNVEYIYDSCDTSIRSLHISDDNRFIFVGVSTGSVVVLATHFWRQ